jgi:membrane protein DedA with SNARE-associated domain
MQQFINDTLAYIQAHPEMAALVIGLTAFGESFAFVSFIFPGFAILVAAGAMVQAGLIDPASAATAGAIGALAGDAISYAIGRRAAQGLRNWRIFAKHPEAFDRGERFFRRYGLASVFIGRFFGPLRAFIPLTAGMCRMPFGAFIAISAVSASVWAPALLFSGYLIGWIAQSGWSIEQKALVAGAALAAFAGLVWLSKKLFKTG